MRLNVILSEAKNLWLFLAESPKGITEMFRFAQHDNVIYEVGST